MPLEIEFLPVGDGASSGDAIVLRYWDGNAWRVGVVDGGYEATGEAICEHIRYWYGTDVIDFVVSTHPDNDHMSGLRPVVRQMRVQQLWMHIPWLHAERILPLFASQRLTREGLEGALRRNYGYVAELCDLALQRGTRLALPFAGQAIGPFHVASPTVAMYEGLLPQFRDTPAPDQERLQMLGHWLTGIGRRIARQVRSIVPESWFLETLREGGITAAENESSVVLYGRFDCGGVLLTGDAGLRALNAAADYCAQQRWPLQGGLWLFQVPHHGSRNNCSPSILNRIVGPPVLQGALRNTLCMISAGAEDDSHPRQVVVNALIRRGLQPLVTRGQTITVYDGVPRRNGLGPVYPLQFRERVEAYE